jgi:hypothetical protein
VGFSTQDDTRKSLGFVDVSLPPYALEEPEGEGLPKREALGSVEDEIIVMNIALVARARSKDHQDKKKS